ncbi:uncharacterized protein UDID_19120 [Ustilago sp. UG-2017a]|nr:uncharacterized protein UDID_19120 [Ustilago sp. UG-2017a]
MTTTTDDSLDISEQLFWQSTTPTSSATQTRNIPALSQSVSGSATGKKNFTWLSADILCLVTIIYNSKSYQHALLPSRELIKSDPGNKLCKHPIFQEIFKLIFPGAPVKPNCIKAKLRWVQETYYKEKKKLSLTGAGMLLEDMDASNPSYASHFALSTNNDEAGIPPHASAEIPMDLSGSEPYDHGACHGPECAGSRKTR